MKRIFGLITICSVLAFPVIAASPVGLGNSGDHPLPATDVHVVKKVPLPPEVGELKGNPHGDPPGQGGTPPGQGGGGGGGEDTSKGAATGILGEPLAEGASRYAIVIGICDYPGGNYDLCISDGDSLRIYKALTTLYGYDSDNIYLFKDMGGIYFDEDTTDNVPTIIAGKPTRANILGAIKSLSPGPNDEVVFFFSGHGADGIAGDGDSERRDEGIVVHDSDNGEFDGNPYIDIIWDGELRTAFSGFATTNRIAFVFDTCLAGGMDDLAATGRVISMGTSETSVSYVYSSEAVNSDAMVDVDGDDQPDGEGVFTRYFVHKGMLDGLADVYDHGYRNEVEGTDVVVEEAFDYAKEIIDNSGYKRQKPTISDEFTDDLLL